MECLKNIIGVTTTENECITAGLDEAQKAEIKLSTSGLYLDELPGGVHLKAVKAADAAKSLYAITTGAIQTAAKTLENDLIIAINQKHQTSRKKYLGTIGRMSFAQTLPAGGRYRGIRILATDGGDTVVKVDRIHFIQNAAATFQLKLYKVPYRSVMGTEIKAWDITTEANAFATIQADGTTGITLPLTENGEPVEYWFMYDTTESGGLPKDTKIECSTCNKTTGAKLGDYLSAKGFEVADPNNLQNAAFSDNSQGIILDVVIKCDNERLFCREYNQDDAVAVTMAWATLFKAGELVIEDVLKSPDINRFTTQNREYLWGKRNHFRAQYQERVNYLAAAIDLTASNCYVCRSIENQPFMTTIFS